MNRAIIFVAAFFVVCVQAFAGDDPFADTHKSLKDQVFVVETDEDMSRESLDRISGHYDLGFTAPDQEFNSPDHYKAGPFGMEDSKDKSTRSY